MQTDQAKSPSDAGTLVADAAIFATRETVLSGLNYLWDVVVRSDQVTNAYALVRTHYTREALMSNLRRAAFVGFALILLGLVIGRIGYAIQPADILSTDWPNVIGKSIRDFGTFVRVIGVLYIACWAGVLVAKASFALTVLRTGSKAVDWARSVAAQLTPDFVFPDSLIKGGEILTAGQAKKTFNSILAIFIWVISFGVLTLNDVVLPVDTSINAFGTIVCTLIALYAISVYFGTNHINVAKWFNILAFSGMAITLFFNSYSVAYMKKVYAGTASQQFAAKREAGLRVLGGHQETDANDKVILGTVLYDELQTIKTLNAKTRTECESRELAARQQHADIMMQNARVTPVKVPDCGAEKKKLAETETAKANRESVSQLRQAAVDRVLASKEKKAAAAKKTKDAQGKETETPAVVGDREILDGVYTNVVDIRTLEASPTKRAQCQARIDALHKRVKAYVAVKEYEGVTVPACSDAPTAANGSPGGGKKPSSADDLLASIKKAQTDASALLKQ